MSAHCSCTAKVNGDAVLRGTAGMTSIIELNELFFYYSLTVEFDFQPVILHFKFCKITGNFY